MTFVFVYGTLKRNHSNDWVLQGAAFVSEGQTVAKCRLFHAGFPVMRRRDKPQLKSNAPIWGEVYEVTDPETMRQLDSLEGEGRMYHRRVKKIRLASGRVVLAHTYVGDTRFWRCRRLPLYQMRNGAYSWPAKIVESGLQTSS